MSRALPVVAVVATVFTASLVGVATAQAATPAATPPTCTISWVGSAHGAWEKATNWSPARVPRPTDAACLGSASPTVTVNASTTVHDIVVGAANLTVVTGATLTIGAQFVVTGGTLTGPGTIQTGQPGGTSCCSDTATLTGPIRLTRRLNLVTAPGLIHVSGTLAFSGGSVLANSGQVLLADGAVLADEDADPRNGYRQSDASASDESTRTNGQARIEVAATMTGSVGTGQSDANLQLLRLTNESPAGELSGLDLSYYLGTITIPYPVTALRKVSMVAIGHLVAASTGQPALPSTLRALTNSTFGVGPAFTAAGSLTFARSSLNVADRLSAPAVVVTDATYVNIYSTGSIRVRQGAGTVTVRPDTPNGPVKIRMTDAAAVVGSLDQRGGTLTAIAGRSNSPQITGDWTLAAGATLSAELGRYRGSTLPVSLAVGGAAALAGAFVLVPDRNTQPVGTVTPIVTAAGGLTGTFSSATLAPGYALSYTATQVLVTYTG